MNSSGKLLDELIGREGFTQLSVTETFQARPAPGRGHGKGQYADGGRLARILDPLQHTVWENPADDERLINQVLAALENPPLSKSAAARARLQTIGGAVPLDSKFTSSGLWMRSSALPLHDETALC